MGSLYDISIPLGILSWTTIGTIIAGWLIYQALGFIYNVSPFHPLYKFPGPKVAAGSYAYEFWFDMVKTGRYTREIKRLHGIYGPIIRINPDELHCNDPNFIDEIYAGGGRKRNKSPHGTKNVPSAQVVSHFGTVDHDLHRKRRAAMSKFFAKTQILRLEAKVQSLVQKMCDRLLKEAPGRPVNVADAYSCIAGDFISTYAFGEPFGFLDQEGWTPNFRAPTAGALNVTYLFRFFPLMKHLLLLGPWLSRFLPQDMAYMIDTFHVTVPNMIEKAKRERKSGILNDNNPNIFAAVFDSDLPPEEKTTYRLTGEGSSLVYAGTETVSTALAALTFYILSKPLVLDRLAQELRTIVDDPCQLPSWTKLETLPYLSATVLEGLRLSYGVSLRSARIATDEDLVYRGKWSPNDAPSQIDISYVVPSGWAIGMSSVIMHHDEDVFPNSHEFIPERWLDEHGQRRKDLERCLLTFSKGSRQCLGIR
nr:trichodiene oxygenase [Colletotrichum truncatum]KAF6790568.1 trichodiene oxygenase [Colletotrichum truncatum]